MFTKQDIEHLSSELASSLDPDVINMLAGNLLKGDESSSQFPSGEPPIAEDNGNECGPPPDIVICAGAYSCDEFDCTFEYLCQGGYECTNDFICDVPGEAPGFYCDGDSSGSGEFICRPISEFSCVNGFACRNDNFQCGDESPSNYRCPGRVFECSSKDSIHTHSFSCGSSKYPGDFQCSNGEHLDFICGRGDDSQADYRCNTTEGFHCAPSHIFLCDPLDGEFACRLFTCRPSGSCTSEAVYHCGANPVFSAPGDFACSEIHNCLSDVSCGINDSSTHDFNCPPGSFRCGEHGEYSCVSQEAVSCSDQVSFTCEQTGVSCFSAETSYYCTGIEQFRCSDDQFGVECLSTFNCPIRGPQTFYTCTGSRFDCRQWGEQTKSCIETDYSCQLVPGYTCVEGDFSCESYFGVTPSTLGCNQDLSRERGSSSLYQIFRGVIDQFLINEIIQIIANRSGITWQEAKTFVLTTMYKYLCLEFKNDEIHHPMNRESFCKLMLKLGCNPDFREGGNECTIMKN